MWDSDPWRPVILGRSHKWFPLPEIWSPNRQMTQSLIELNTRGHKRIFPGDAVLIFIPRRWEFWQLPKYLTCIFLKFSHFYACATSRLCGSKPTHPENRKRPGKWRGKWLHPKEEMTSQREVWEKIKRRPWGRAVGGRLVLGWQEDGAGAICLIYSTRTSTLSKQLNFQEETAESPVLLRGVNKASPERGPSKTSGALSAKKGAGQEEIPNRQSTGKKRITSSRNSVWTSQSQKADLEWRWFYTRKPHLNLHLGHLRLTKVTFRRWQ